MLAGLSVEELKDIVAEHGMDSAKLAMRWKKPAKLIDLIVAKVDARARKGYAFPNDSDRGESGTETARPPTPSAPDGQLLQAAVDGLGTEVDQVP